MVRSALTAENLVYLLGSLAVMDLFAAMLGLHAGMNYDNSRSAIGVSLGTLFFLFIGIATCMRVMIAFSGSFHMQLQPFSAFMGGGTMRALRGLGCSKPVAGDPRGFATLPRGHILRHYQLPA